MHGTSKRNGALSWTQRHAGRWLLARLVNIVVAIVFRTVGSVFTLAVPVAAAVYYLANKEPAPEGSQGVRRSVMRPVSFVQNVWQIWRLSRSWRQKAETFVQQQITAVITQGYGQLRTTFSNKGM